MKKDQMTEESQEIWSAIRYLDPDEKHSAASAGAMVVLLALVLVICIVLIELRLRGL